MRLRMCAHARKRSGKHGCASARTRAPSAGEPRIQCAAEGPSGRVHVGTPISSSMYVPLSEEMEGWHFNLRAPPDCSARKTLDVTFKRDGVWNAVVFWFKLTLLEGIDIWTGGPHLRPLPGAKPFPHPSVNSYVQRSLSGPRGRKNLIL